MTQTAVSKAIADILGAVVPSMGTVGTDIFYMALGPDATDSQVTIFDEEGFNSSLPETFEQPMARIYVRGDKDADAETAYNKAREIYEYLIGYADDGNFTGFIPLGSINALGRDDNTRPQFEMAFYTFRNSLA